MHKNKATKSFGHMLAGGAKYSLNAAWYLLGEIELMKFYAKGGHVYILGHKAAPFRKVERTSSEIRLRVCSFRCATHIAGIANVITLLLHNNIINVIVQE